MNKTIIFNGSPRSNGETAFFIQELQKELTGEIWTINAYHSRISPCVDCRYCWSHDECAVDDPMTALYEQLLSCNRIVIASPIYFSNLTPPLLGVFSRLQLFWAMGHFQNKPPAIAPKKGLLILTGGGDGSPKPAQKLADTFFHQLNTEKTGEVLSLHTNSVPACADKNAYFALENAVVKLNEEDAGFFQCNPV